MILQCDPPAYTIAAVSNDFVRTSGMKRASVLGRSHFEVFPENPADARSEGVHSLRHSFDYVLRHRRPHSLPLVRYDIPDGQGGFLEKYWKSTNAPVLDDDGELRYLIHTSEDVTSQVQAERAEAVSELLRASEQRQAFLLELNDHLRSLTDPRQIQYEAARLIAGFLGADRVGYAEDNGDDRTVSVTIDYAGEMPSLIGQYNYEDYGLDLLHELREGRVVVRSDIAGNPALSTAVKAAHAALQLGATVNVPLLKDGSLVAIFFMHFRAAHHWTTGEVQLMEEVAGRTWETVLRARTEQALRESEARFRLMMDTLPQSIWITDAEGRAEYLNKHWCDYCGEPFSETTASEISVRHLHPDDAPRVMEAFGTAMQSGTPWVVEQRNRSKDGEYRWFLNRGTPYRDPATGRITKWFGVGIDIHDRKLAEEALRSSEGALEKKVLERTAELEKLNAELKRSNQNLEEFAYAASHDMKEPIRKIHFFADRLKERLLDKMEEEDRRYFERLEAGTKRMATLIDDLLLYSHVNRGLASVEPVDLNQMLSFVLDDLELHIEQKGARVEAGPLPLVNGRPRQLQQLFENLIGNALKYSRADQPPVVRITSRLVDGSARGIHATALNRDKKYHLIEISDNGIGFDPEDAERIFNVFTRLHGNSLYRGTGVGLSIAQKVVENHDGLIWAEGKLGTGATFFVLLPAL